MPAEKLDFPEGYFDVVTACQCFTYFDHPTLAPQVYRILKEGGSFVVLYMAWLPFEDKIAGESERLVLKYNPGWNGCGETVHPIQIPSCYKDHFEIVYSEEYRLNVPFTRESWNGRMKCCRGIQASLPDEKVQEWEREHLSFLESSAPPQFEVLHYAAITQLRKK